MAVKSMHVLYSGLQPGMDKGMLFTFGVGGGTRLESCFLCYLIRTDEGNVLVDTGVHPEDAARMAAMTGGEIIQGTDEQLPAQLEKLGLGLDDIDYLVLTHLHWDHIGWMTHLKKATLVIQQEEYRFATEPPPYVAWLYLPERYKTPGLKWRMVDGDHVLMPGITLLAAPGHTPGCQAVMVDLPRDGTILLAGDAGFLQENFEKELIPMFFGEPRQALLSIRKLNVWASVRNAPIFPTHDIAYWREHIRKPPEGYS